MKIDKNPSDRRPRVLVAVPTLGTRPDWVRASITSIVLSSRNCDADVLIRIITPTNVNLDPQLFRDNPSVAQLVSDRPGLSAAINDGWSSPHDADYVAWLGDDDLLSPESLHLTLTALESSRLAPAAYGKVRSIDEAGKTLWIMRPGRWAPAYMMIGKNLVPQPGSLFRWTAIIGAGALDESLRAAMDQDLFMRLRKQGRLLYAGGEVAAFRIHGSSITTNGSGSDEGERLRSLYSPRRSRWTRPLTRVTDRVIFGLMRRLPAAPSPVGSNGRRYTDPL